MLAIWEPVEMLYVITGLEWFKRTPEQLDHIRKAVRGALADRGRLIA